MTTTISIKVLFGLSFRADFQPSSKEDPTHATRKYVKYISRRRGEAKYAFRLRQTLPIKEVPVNTPVTSDDAILFDKIRKNIEQIIAPRRHFYRTNEKHWVQINR